MTIRRVLFVLVTALLGGSANPAEREKFRSGPQAGENLPGPFQCLVAYSAPHEEGSDDVALFPAADIKWRAGPPSLPKGALMAVLEGDPTKEGPFVFRVKVPDGYKVPPHTHPKTERVTVLSGTFNKIGRA